LSFLGLVVPEEVLILYYSSKINNKLIIKMKLTFVFCPSAINTMTTFVCLSSKAMVKVNGLNGLNGVKKIAKLAKQSQTREPFFAVR